MPITVTPYQRFSVQNKLYQVIDVLIHQVLLTHVNFYAPCFRSSVIEVMFVIHAKCGPQKAIEWAGGGGAPTVKTRKVVTHVVLSI